LAKLYCRSAQTKTFEDAFGKDQKMNKPDKGGYPTMAL